MAALITPTTILKILSPISIRPPFWRVFCPPSGGANRLPFYGSSFKYYTIFCAILLPKFSKNLQNTNAAFGEKRVSNLILIQSQN